MKYELYEFNDLSKYVQGKVVAKAKKLLKKGLPGVESKDEFYVERNKEQLNKFLYNKKGRPVCTKDTYEEEL